MKGAIIGDIIGSAYEFHNVKEKDFDLFPPKAHFTDDTVMTLAVAKSLYEYEKNEWGTDLRYEPISGEQLEEVLTMYMYDIGNLYRTSYGSRFKNWLRSSDPQPYNSWGNGAPMRCSAAGWFADTPDRAFVLGMITAQPSHNHVDAMIAAGLTADLICRARHKATKEEMFETAKKFYVIPGIDDVRPWYRFDVSCQGTMPVALAAFFESRNFEDAIRNAVSVGGDSDTIAAITGSIAEAYYGLDASLWRQALPYLSDELRAIVKDVYDYLDYDRKKIRPAPKKSTTT